MKTVKPKGQEQVRLDGARQFEDDLMMAERHVIEGRDRVVRQREIVLKLRASGLGSDLAEGLLMQFEDTLAAHEIHLIRLRNSG
jgi:hypothetical protein